MSIENKVSNYGNFNQEANFEIFGTFFLHIFRSMLTVFRNSRGLWGPVMEISRIHHFFIIKEFPHITNIYLVIQTLIA